jgi:hypothetical protein
MGGQLADVGNGKVSLAAEDHGAKDSAPTEDPRPIGRAEFVFLK